MQQISSLYLELVTLGLDKEKVRELRLSVPNQMLEDVRWAIEKGHNVNAQSGQGITLVST